MTDIEVRHIDDIAPYAGPHAIDGIRFRAAGRALGVTAWGMNILEIDAGCEAHPEHDHTQDGQEEVYVILRGSARLVAGGETRILREGDLARVGPERTRKLLPGPDGVTVLALGGTPGEPYGRGAL